MYLCYIDESGTPTAGNTSHYILAGLSIPIQCWRICDTHLERIKSRYGLTDQEIHVAWILRKYIEQDKISGFNSLNYTQRRYQVTAYRTAELLRLQRVKNKALYEQTKKNYRKTEAYVHLTFDERRKLIREMAETLSHWTFARLFAECVDKIHFNPLISTQSVDEQAIEQVVSRFEQFLVATTNKAKRQKLGLLIHDNNETVAKKHTALVKKFHKTGTLWTSLKHIVETPLFVNSELTGMVQIADLCAYALRRYLENQEEELFDLIFKRADRVYDNVVGIRHYTKASCPCKICKAHRKSPQTVPVAPGK